MIICAIDCVIMTDDRYVIVTTTNQRLRQSQYECGLDNSHVCSIARTKLVYEMM